MLVEAGTGAQLRVSTSWSRPYTDRNILEVTICHGRTTVADFLYSLLSKKVAQPRHRCDRRMTLVSWLFVVNDYHCLPYRGQDCAALMTSS